MWQENYKRTQTLAFVELALAKAESQYGPFVLRPSDANTVTDAIAKMEQGLDMDLLVTGNQKDWEEKLLPVYVPLDRGLLGFRVCLTGPGGKAQSFEQIQIPSDFARLEMSVAVGSKWPDRHIMASNLIDVVHKDNYQTLLELVHRGEVDCFSRSVFEVAQELDQNPDLTVAPHVGFIYPLADLIYVRPGANELHEAIVFGLHTAMDDGSFMNLYHHYYRDALSNQNFYFRKLLIMNDPDISSAARQAINQFGVASFSKHIQ